MEESTKVVYIINSLEVGGAEFGLCRLLNGLKSQEYDVTVLALNSHSDRLTSKIPPWVRVVDLRLRSGIGVSTIRELYSTVRTADVIVGSLYHSSMLARLCGVLQPNATIATWHHANLFESDLRRLSFKFTSQLSDVVLADSEPVSEMLIADLGLDPNLVHTVPIAGINLDEYTIVEHRDCEEITVGTVGRLSEQKNHKMILDVAEELRDDNFRFEIAGDGELYDTIQEEITERDLHNVTLYGLVEDVPSFLADLDIYFQPSLWEGLCITVLEAMASGLPVVGSGVGGIGRNVEKDSSGFLYEPDNLDGFVSGIETLATDPELRKQFGTRGRAIVKEGFTQDMLVSEFEKAIETDSVAVESSLYSK